MTLSWSCDQPGLSRAGNMTAEMTKHKVFNISGMSPFPYLNHFQIAAGGKTYRHRVVKIYISNHIYHHSNDTRCCIYGTYAVESVSDCISVTAGWTTDEHMDSSRFKSLFLLIARLKILYNIYIIYIFWKLFSLSDIVVFKGDNSDIFKNIRNVLNGLERSGYVRNAVYHYNLPPNYRELPR